MTANFYERFKNKDLMNLFELLNHLHSGLMVHLKRSGNFCMQMQVWGDLSFYIGGSLPLPCRAVGLPAAPPPDGRGLHAIELKF